MPTTNQNLTHLPSNLIKTSLLDGGVDFPGFWTTVNAIDAALDAHPHVASMALTYVIAKRLEK